VRGGNRKCKKQQQGDCEEHDERTLDESLPGAADRFFFGREMVDRHSCSASAFSVPSESYENTESQ
jgi:hypothetical protein